MARPRLASRRLNVTLMLPPAHASTYRHLRAVHRLLGGGRMVWADVVRAGLEHHERRLRAEALARGMDWDRLGIEASAIVATEPRQGRKRDAVPVPSPSIGGPLGYGSKGVSPMGDWGDD